MTPLTREDPYFWLRDDKREDPEILSHLRAENAYTTQQTAHLESLRKELYDEHLSHLQETDDAAPYINGPFFYYTRTVKGLSYKLHCRSPVHNSFERLPSIDAKEMVFLDENELASGHSHCGVIGVRPSPDHSFIAYCVDFKGDETYVAVVKDLDSGLNLADHVEGVAGAVEWGADKTCFFYRTQDAAKRPHKVWRHVLGTPQLSDECIHTEPDEVCNVSISKSLSGRLLFVDSGSTDTSEIWMLDLLQPGSSLQVLQARRTGLRYFAEHDGGEGLLVWTNRDGAVNNRLMSTPLNAPGEQNWREVLPYDPRRTLRDVLCLKRHVVLEGREDGLTQLWAMDKDALGAVVAGSLRRLAFPEALYEVELSTNKEYGISNNSYGEHGEHYGVGSFL